LLGVAAGWRWADPIAGWFVTLFICRVAWEVTSRIVHHLMDGVNPEQLKCAEAAAQSVPGVLAVNARGRWMGRRLILEIEGALPAGTSLKQADEIGRQVSIAVHRAVNEARFVQWIPICHSSGNHGA
jgi:divalent metal cation (Fe/Co/Zn/Cd) transporter